MSGHRDGQARRDLARAERMRTRIASAPDEFQALGHALDWLRMELRHLERCGHADARTRERASEARTIARQTLRDLVSRAESVIKLSEETG
jgi:hypothetical protein